MADVSTDLLEMALREIAAARTEPWYPSVYCQATGVPREAVDRCLDQLRLAGLVRLTDWEQGRGQGYALTPEGQIVLDNPRLLARLREGREIPRPRLRTAPPEDRSLRETGTTYDRGEAIRNALLAPGRPVITIVLLWLNIAVFLLGLVQAVRLGVANDYLASTQGQHPVPTIRHELGALFLPDLTVNNQWWRLLSYCFVHGGLLHLAMNMFALYMFGALVEKLWGRVRYLIVYLVSGLGGAVLQLVVAPNSGLVGASGCLCGLLGSMGVWVVMNRPFLPAKLASNWMNNLLVNAMLIVFISMLPNVSWAGHLGGGVAGAVISVPLIWTLYGRGAQRWLGWVGVAAVPVIAFLILYKSIAPALAQGQELAQLEALVTSPEFPKARRDYAPILRKMDQIGDDAFRAAEPFLTGAKKPQTDIEEAKATRAKIVAAHTKLQEQIDRLAKVPRFDNTALQKHVQLAKDFSTKEELFINKMAQGLSPGGNWSRADLIREWQELVRFWQKQVRGSVYDLLLSADQ